MVVEFFTGLTDLHSNHFKTVPVNFRIFLE